MSNKKPANMFKPGQSGNPGGKISTQLLKFRQLTKDEDIQAAYNLVVSEMKNRGKKKTECAIWLLEMYFGKPRQAVEGFDSQPLKVEIIAPKAGILNANKS